MSGPPIPDLARPPVIAVCAALEQTRWAVWDMPAAVVATNYLEAIRRAGGVALLVPPDPAVIADPDLVLDRVDGLLLIGGPDVDPVRYGADRHDLSEEPVPMRDEMELALVARARARCLPTLGICRGIQVMNVAAGGTLEQHLPDRLGDEAHRRVLGTFAGNEHEVRLEPESLAARACGAALHRVTSHHHQGLAEVGSGLVVTGRAEDGVPEALEDPEAGYFLGVQWHPEADVESRVIASLVCAAAGAAAERPAPAGVRAD